MPEAALGKAEEARESVCTPPPSSSSYLLTPRALSAPFLDFYTKGDSISSELLTVFQALGNSPDPLSPSSTKAPGLHLNGRTVSTKGTRTALGKRSHGVASSGRHLENVHGFAS